jgi:UDP-N-acetylglucosamine 2-epimerase (non-hydrolysing)
VAVVFGTRPEATKMAPVIRALGRYPEVEVRVWVTAQHREMLDQVLAHFQIRPDVDLDIMRPGQSLVDVAVRTLEGLTPVLRRERPDLVLVHGDTSTTLYATLAAYYEHVPVGHVEAGLRTGDLYFPFPEEVNRLLTDRIARLHFAPTEEAKANLLREGIAEATIHVTGNTAIDAVLWTAPPRRPRHPRLVLVECHRRENLGEPIRRVFRGVLRAVADLPDVEVLVSVHPNPGVQAAAAEVFTGAPRATLVDPPPYPEWVRLMSEAVLLVTDSGGLQEEAPALGLPVVVARTVTERPEAVQAGTVLVAGTDEEAVAEAVHGLLTDEARRQAMASRRNPYGDGRAGERIAAVVARELGVR